MRALAVPSNTPRNLIAAVTVAVAGVVCRFAAKAGAAAVVQATLGTAFWTTLACLYVVPWAVRQK